ncbi:hypothetical protein BJX76DRAFT_357125 [Aspergillus varians]
MNPTEDQCLLKARNAQGRFTLDLAAWQSRLAIAPDTLFDELCEQQKAYGQLVLELQGKLTQYKHRINSLEAKLVVQGEWEEKFEARFAELNGELVAVRDWKLRNSWRRAKIGSRSGEGGLARHDTVTATATATVHDGSTPEAKDTTEARFVSFPDNATPTKALPDPPKLIDGVQTKFATWRDLVEMKFRENADHFDTAASRLAFLISWTAGEAHDHLLTRLRSKVLDQMVDVKDALE